MSEFTLTRYDTMRQAIIEAKNIDDVKEIIDKSEALRHYAKQVGESLQNQNMIADIKIRAERQAGKLTREIPRKAGRRTDLTSGHDVQRLKTKAEVLQEAGIDVKTATRWEAEAAIPDEVFEAYVAETKGEGKELTSAGLLQIAKQQKRAEREDKREQRRQTNADKAIEAQNPLDIGARFATILIDPPWDWGDEGDINQMGRAKPDYATMTIEQLAALPVGELADVDCHIYLWITNRSLPKGFALLEGWGFRYITCLTWVKPHFGMGNYFRGQTEHILFGVKGSQMLRRHDVATVFHAERGKGGHSSKPPMIYGLIESCSPGPYLEMFSRVERDNWYGWGADA